MSTRIGKAAGSIDLASRVAGLLMTRKVNLDGEYHHRCLQENSRLVVAITHGGAISFAPVAIALVRSTLLHDPKRRIVATMHPAWWGVPGLRQLPRFLTGADRPYTFLELQAALTTQPALDYFALPESDNSIYGELGEVKPFRMHGFIELSIRAHAPMLLVAHKGTEGWYRPVDGNARLPSALLGRLPKQVYHALNLSKEVVLGEVAKQRWVNVPMPLRRASLDIGLELYKPKDFDKGLDDDYKVRRRQLLAEGERIRKRMQGLYDALG